MHKVEGFVAVAVCCLWGLFCVDAALASNLFFDVSHAGETAVNIGLSLDSVEKLAGIKLVIEYDENVLIYKDMVKSTATSSLLHVVNDKKPGQLIIVMAGANGVTGKKLKIFDLKFQAKEAAVGKTVVKVVDIQLMSEDLQEIACPESSIDASVP